MFKPKFQQPFPSLQEILTMEWTFVKSVDTIYSMRISHGTRITEISDTNGYGYATSRMIESLTRLGHKITQNDAEAPVEIWFDQPHHWKWQEDKLISKTSTSYSYHHQYRVGYHPWESTKLKEKWAGYMNECDEIWTPSPLIAEWYAEDGVKKPIYVYEHGVDKIWSPKERTVDDGVIKFLHCGGEAARKRLDMTMQAFRVAFPDRNDVRLTVKMISQGWNVPMNGKITLINKKMSLQEMVDLYHDHHIYLYPSHGEGFGLTPLQAMATGMPTITVPAWAPYHKYLDPDLSIPSELKNSPWGQTHPGKMFRPDFDIMVDMMRYAADNYEKVQKFAQEQVPAIQKQYDWDTITKKTFDALDKRL